METITTVRDFEACLRKLKGSPLNGDEGVVFGDPDQPVRGIQVCWIASLEAIEAAIRNGANLILAHEALFYPYPGHPPGSPPTDVLSWPTNRNRINLLARHQIVVMRLHGTMDAICIHDVLAALLGLGRPVVAETPSHKLYEIEPRTIAEVVEGVKRTLHMDHVRMTPCDHSRVVRRIGLPWGGLGLFVNIGYMQSLLPHKPDLFIAGESDCYGFLFATDAGVPMIETSHDVSENPGISAFADQLRASLSVPVRYHENERCWRWV